MKKQEARKKRSVLIRRTTYAYPGNDWVKVSRWAGAGLQGRADTLQVRPCKLAVAIPGDTTVGTTLHPSVPADSAVAGSKTLSTSVFLPLRWYAPGTTV